MALTFPGTPSNGQVYTDDNNISWQFDGVKWEVSQTASYKTFNGIKIGLDSDFNATATSTAISWGTASIDVGDYYSVSTPTRINVPSTGYYRINFSTKTSASGSSYTIAIKRNGTITLSTTTITINQFINYDEIIELSAGDYIEVYVSDQLSSGALLASSTVMEVTRIGLSSGTAAETFSGARAKITGVYSTSSSAVAIPWQDVDFNVNANAAGDQYWTIANASRLTVSTSSYYRVKIVVLTNSFDTYTLTLKKNGTTDLTTINLGALNTVQLDEIYNLTSADYLELYINDADDTGGLLVGTYLEILREGN